MPRTKAIFFSLALLLLLAAHSWAAAPLPKSTQEMLKKLKLSGSLLAKQDWRPSVGKRAGLPVFQSHGMQDPILPYVMAERLRDELMTAGLAVQWHSFRGGHEIPMPVLVQLRGFITRVVRKP